jgi:hypothetical protein
VLRARGYRRDIVSRVHDDVVAAFNDAKMKVEVSGREKTVYSIYRKMEEKHAGFAQVNDIFGFRIIVQTMPECYLALGVLHQLYKPVPGRFKDYIAIPKPNGYQSLHTTLVGPLGTSVEFQIRTEEMHAVAEAGVAAHWLYKVGQEANPGDVAQRLGALWLQVAAGHPGRDPRRRRVPGARQDRPVPGRGLRLHAQEQDPGPAQGRHAGGLRLRHPLRRRRPLRGRQDQRRAGHAAGHAEFRRRGGGGHRPGARPTRPG